MSTKTCKHLIEGGQNRPKIYCGKPAKRVVKQICLDGPEPKDTEVCGTHGNFWKVRGFEVTILQTKNSFGETVPSVQDWRIAEERAIRKLPSCSKCGDPTHRLPDCPDRSKRL